MSKLLMKSLKADLPALAELIRSQGRGRDTVLAHITPKEAALLKRRGGSGTINPDTGLPEFQEDFGGYDIGFGQDVYTPEVQPSDITGAEFTPQQVQDYGYTTPQDIMAGAYGGGFTPAQGMPADQFQAPEAPIDIGFGPGRYTPEVTRAEIGGMPADQFARFTQPGVVTPPQADRSILEKLGITPREATRLGLGAAMAGGLTAQNVARTRQAASQAQAARGELSALGKPYQEAGAQLTGAAQRGELTPSSQQALQAAQAQMAQGVASRGGVGAAQLQTQIAGLRNMLLENQYNFGLRVAQIGDNYAMGAIKTGLEADRAIGAANQQFYGQLAQLLAPFLTGAPAPTPTRTA